MEESIVYETTNNNNNNNTIEEEESIHQFRCERNEQDLYSAQCENAGATVEDANDEDYGAHYNSKIICDYDESSARVTQGSRFYPEAEETDGVGDDDVVIVHGKMGKIPHLLLVALNTLCTPLVIDACRGLSWDVYNSLTQSDDELQDDDDNIVKSMLTLNGVMSTREMVWRLCNIPESGAIIILFRNNENGNNGAEDSVDRISKDDNFRNSTSSLLKSPSQRESSSTSPPILSEKQKVQSARSINTRVKNERGGGIVANNSNSGGVSNQNHPLVTTNITNNHPICSAHIKLVRASKAVITVPVTSTESAMIDESTMSFNADCGDGDSMNNSINSKLLSDHEFIPYSWTVEESVNFNATFLNNIPMSYRHLSCIINSEAHKYVPVGEIVFQSLIHNSSSKYTVNHNAIRSTSFDVHLSSSSSSSPIANMCDTVTVENGLPKFGKSSNMENSNNINSNSASSSTRRNKSSKPRARSRRLVKKNGDGGLVVKNSNNSLKNSQVVVTPDAFSNNRKDKSASSSSSNNGNCDYRKAEEEEEDVPLESANEFDDNASEWDFEDLQSIQQRQEEIMEGEMSTNDKMMDVDSEFHFDVTPTSSSSALQKTPSSLTDLSSSTSNILRQQQQQTSDQYISCVRTYQYRNVSLIATTAEETIKSENHSDIDKCKSSSEMMVAGADLNPNSSSMLHPPAAAFKTALSKVFIAIFASPDDILQFVDSDHQSQNDISNIVLNGDGSGNMCDEFENVSIVEKGSRSEDDNEIVVDEESSPMNVVTREKDTSDTLLKSLIRTTMTTNTFKKVSSPLPIDKSCLKHFVLYPRTALSNNGDDFDRSNDEERVAKFVQSVSTFSEENPSSMNDYNTMYQVFYFLNSGKLPLQFQSATCQSEFNTMMQFWNELVQCVVRICAQNMQHCSSSEEDESSSTHLDSQSSSVGGSSDNDDDDPNIIKESYSNGDDNSLFIDKLHHAMNVSDEFKNAIQNWSVVISAIVSKKFCLRVIATLFGSTVLGSWLHSRGDEMNTHIDVVGCRGKEVEEGGIISEVDQQNVSPSNYDFGECSCEYCLQDDATGSATRKNYYFNVPTKHSEWYPPSSSISNNNGDDENNVVQSRTLLLHLRHHSIISFVLHFEASERRQSKLNCHKNITSKIAERFSVQSSSSSSSSKQNHDVSNDVSPKMSSQSSPPLAPQQHVMFRLYSEWKNKFSNGIVVEEGKETNSKNINVDSQSVSSDMPSENPASRISYYDYVQAIANMDSSILKPLSPNSAPKHKQRMTNIVNLLRGNYQCMHSNSSSFVPTNGNDHCGQCVASNYDISKDFQSKSSEFDGDDWSSLSVLWRTHIQSILKHRSHFNFAQTFMKKNNEKDLLSYNVVNIHMSTSPPSSKIFKSLLSSMSDVTLNTSDDAETITVPLGRNRRKTNGRNNTRVRKLSASPIGGIDSSDCVAEGEDYSSLASSSVSISKGKRRQKQRLPIDVGDIDDQANLLLLSDGFNAKKKVSYKRKCLKPIVVENDRKQKKTSDDTEKIIVVVEKRQYRRKNAAVDSLHTNTDNPGSLLANNGVAIVPSTTRKPRSTSKKQNKLKGKSSSDNQFQSAANSKINNNAEYESIIFNDVGYEQQQQQQPPSLYSFDQNFQSTISTLIDVFESSSNHAFNFRSNYEDENAVMHRYNNHHDDVYPSTSRNPHNDPNNITFGGSRTFESFDDNSNIIVGEEEDENDDHLLSSQMFGVDYFEIIDAEKQHHLLHQNDINSCTAASAPTTSFANYDFRQDTIPSSLSSRNANVQVLQEGDVGEELIEHIIISSQDMESVEIDGNDAVSQLPAFLFEVDACASSPSYSSSSSPSSSLSSGTDRSISVGVGLNNDYDESDIGNRSKLLGVGSTTALEIHNSHICDFVNYYGAYIN